MKTLPKKRTLSTRPQLCKLSSKILILSVTFCLNLSLILAERRHVIELYNKNHQITKNIPSLESIQQQNSAQNNVLNSLQKHSDYEKELKPKISDLSGIKNLKTGVDYVQEAETFTLSRRKPKPLRAPQPTRKSQLPANPKLNPKFRDYAQIVQKTASGEPRILNVPTGSTQHLNPPKSGRIALESSPNNIVIEAPLYNFISHHGNPHHAHPEHHPHYHGSVTYGEYSSSLPVPEPQYAHVNFIPEAKKSKVSPGLAHSVAVPPLSSNVGAYRGNDHLVESVAVHGSSPPLSPHLQLYSESLPVPEPHYQTITHLAHPIPHPEVVPFPHPLPLPHHHSAHPHPLPVNHKLDSGAITEAEIQAEILEHFFNDDFFKGFFDHSPPVPPLIPAVPHPEVIPKPEPPVGGGHQTPLGYESPYIFPTKPTIYNVHDVHPVAPVYQPSVSYHSPHPGNHLPAHLPNHLPGVRYFDELKAAYSNNIEKKLSAGSDNKNGLQNTTESSLQNPEAESKTPFPIMIKKKVLGQENLQGKPWGQKTVISYSDPQDPSNFVQVSEMRMTVNRPLDAESASTHINQLIDHFGTGQHQPLKNGQRKFDDRK